MPRPMEDYVEVSERIERFYEKYPEGSLRCKSIRAEEIDGNHFLIYVAQAFRTADDQAPAEGSAWEPVPGKTNFTRDSELMNAETSAWGRAIAALGFEVKRGIASRQEVMNRRGADGSGDDRPRGQSPRVRSDTAAVSANGFSSDKQKDFFTRLLQDAGASQLEAAEITAYASEELGSHRTSRAIDALKDDPAKAFAALSAETQKWMSRQTNVPGNTEGLPELSDEDKAKYAA